MELRVRTRIALGTLLMVAASACGGDGGDGDDRGGGDGDGNGEPVASGDFLPAVAAVMCDALDACAAPFLSAFLGGNLDCDSDLTRQIEDETGDLEALIADGRVRYDAASAGDCLDALQRAECNLFREDPMVTCEAALDGTAQLGADCDVDVECQGDAYCKEEVQCPGTCTAYAKAGESCLDAECKDGSSCGSEGRCIADLGKGQDCGDDLDAECEFGTLCAGEDAQAGTLGKCTGFDEVFAGDEGDPCDLSAGALCNEGLVCAVLAVDMVNGLTMECARPAASGAPCKVAIPAQCPPGEWCELPAETPDAFEGTCRALPQADEPCGSDPTLIYSCAAGLTCVQDAADEQGTCKAVQRLGGSCSSDEQCYSDSCVDGKCVSGLGCSL
jgi:hypothetical protein